TALARFRRGWLRGLLERLGIVGGRPPVAFPNPLPEGQRPGRLLSDVVQGSHGRAGDRPDGIEHSSVMLLEKGLSRRPGEETPKLTGIRYDNQVVQLANIPDAGRVSLASDRAEEGPRVADPASVRTARVGKQRARELIGVVRGVDLSKQIPL